jgi:hypothetical protein
MAVLTDEKKSDSLNEPQIGEPVVALSEAQHQPKDASLDEEDIKCPSHTTERRLLTKIDLHVVPFLCIMYLLAFLGKQTIDMRQPVTHLSRSQSCNRAANRGCSYQQIESTLPMPGFLIWKRTLE